MKQYLYLNLSLNIITFVILTGCYNKHYEKGVYQCIVCHQDLFSSDTKYDSGCGWPAFNDVLDKGKVTLHRDASIPGAYRPRGPLPGQLATIWPRHCSALLAVFIANRFEFCFYLSCRFVAAPKS